MDPGFSQWDIKESLLEDFWERLFPDKKPTTKISFVTLAVPSFLWGHNIGTVAAILWSREDHDHYKEPGALTLGICWATYVFGISNAKLLTKWTVKVFMVHTDDSWVFCHLQPKAFLLMTHWLRFSSRVSTGLPSSIFIVLSHCSREEEQHPLHPFSAHSSHHEWKILFNHFLWRSSLTTVTKSYSK